LIVFEKSRSAILLEGMADREANIGLKGFTFLFSGEQERHPETALLSTELHEEIADSIPIS